MALLGPELLANGNFEASTGVGATSSIGPGWTTGYAPCGPSIFAGPCGAATYAFFTTNAGQVTGNNPNATPIPAIGARSMAVNVGPNTTVPIISWVNIPLVNGQKYRLRLYAAQIFAPFAVAIRINGGTDGNIPVTAPAGSSQWQSTVTDFIYTGPTGNQTVGLFSNSGVAGGNDHTFDEISLRTVSGLDVPCDCCPSGPPRCALVQVMFDAPTVLVSAGTSTGTYPLTRWSDGDISGGNFTGFNSPGVDFTAVTSPVIDLSFASAQNRIRGLREWNQGGGDLNDNDGFASWDATFFDNSAVVLATGNMIMGNGGAPFTFLLPGVQELNGVKRVRLDNMRKLNPGATVAPLVREVEALQIQTVYPCRRRTGAIEWYSEAGELVPSGDVIACP